MKKKFILEGLDCANCAAKMEKAINGVPPTFPTKPTLRHKMEKYLIIHSL